MRAGSDGSYCLHLKRRIPIGAAAAGRPRRPAAVPLSASPVRDELHRLQVQGQTDPATEPPAVRQPGPATSSTGSRFSGICPTPNDCMYVS